MGRLYWKFFAFFWLAQVLTVLGVGLTMWIIGSGQEPHGGDFPAQFATHGAPPPPPVMGTDPDRPPLDRYDRMQSGEETNSQDGHRKDVPPGAPPPPAPGNALSPPVLPLIVGSFMSLLFAALLAHYFSRPIRTLRHAFNMAARGKLDTRIGIAMASRRDELSSLGNDFDRMAERLQKLVESKQRLLHDVSHELRSPLARLQAVIDLMQQQPERTGEFLTRIERESNRIDRLVGELLTLARLDNGFPGNQAVTLDLNEVIDAITEDASFEAETKQCRVNVKLPDKVCMNGYPDLLHRAIENVVRNAIRHAPEGSTIYITGELNDEKNRVYLHILDEGEGVAEHDLKLLFEPFYRSTSADQFQGYGMGMAITRRIVEAHDGTVAARNQERGGLAVTLELPLEGEAGC